MSSNLVKNSVDLCMYSLNTKEEIIFKIDELKKEMYDLIENIENPDMEALYGNEDENFDDDFGDYDEEQFLRESDDTSERVLELRKSIDDLKKRLFDLDVEYLAEEKELVDIEFNSNIENIYKIVFNISGHFYGSNSITCNILDDKVEISKEFMNFTGNEIKTDVVNKDFFMSKLSDLHIGEWKNKYHPAHFLVLDGESWSLEIYYDNDLDMIKKEGFNAYPYNYVDLINLIEV